MNYTYKKVAKNIYKILTKVPTFEVRLKVAVDIYYKIRFENLEEALAHRDAKRLEFGMCRVDVEVRDGEKHCCTCDQVKSVEAFTKCLGPTCPPDGLHSWCKSCVRKYKSSPERREQTNARRKAQRENDPLIALLRNASTSIWKLLESQGTDKASGQTTAKNYVGVEHGEELKWAWKLSGKKHKKLPGWDRDHIIPKAALPWVEIRHKGDEYIHYAVEWLDSHTNTQMMKLKPNRHEKSSQWEGYRHQMAQDIFSLSSKEFRGLSSYIAMRQIESDDEQHEEMMSFLADSPQTF